MRSLPRLLKKSIIYGVVFAFIFILLFFVGVSWLGTSSGSEFILRQVKKYLQNNTSLRLEYQKARINLGSGLSFEALTLGTHGKEQFNQFKLVVNNIDIKYHIHFWKRELSFDFIRLKKPKVFLDWSSQAAPNQPDSSKIKLPMKILDPVFPISTIKIEEIEIEDLGIEAKVNANQSQTNLILSGLNFKTFTQIGQHRAEARGKLGFEKLGKFEGSRSFKKNGQPQKIQVSPESHLDWSLELLPNSSQIVLGSVRLDLSAVLVKEKFLPVPVRLVAEFSSKDLDNPQDNPKIENERGSLRASFYFDQKALGTAGLLIKSSENNLLVQSQLDWVIHESMVAHLHPVLTQFGIDIRSYGPFRTIVNAEASISDIKTRWMNLEKWHLVKSAIHYKLTSQLQPLGSVGHFRQLGPVNLQLQGDYHPQRENSPFEAKANIILSEVSLPFYKRRWSLEYQADLSWNPRGSSLKATSQLSMDKHPLVQLNGVASLVGEKLQSDVDFEVQLKKPWLQEIMLGLKSKAFLKSRFSLMDFEGWSFRSQLKVQSEGFQKTWIEGKGELHPQGFIHFNDFGLRVDPSRNIEILLKAAIEPGVQDAQLTVQMPQFEISGLGQCRASKSSINVTLGHEIETLAQWEIQLEDFVLDKKWTGNASLVSQFQFQGNLQLQKDSSFSLEDLSLKWSPRVGTSPSAHFLLSSQASGNFKGQRTQVQGKLRVQMPEGVSDGYGSSLSGSLEMPWTMALNEKRVKWEGEFIFQKVNLKREGFEIFGLSGSVPFVENLICHSPTWDFRQVAFSDMITQNPFERADFSRIQPLLKESTQFQVEGLGWQGKSYGPLIGFISLRQNRLFAHQFHLNLNPGFLYGEMFLDLQPASLQVGILSRLSGIDLNQILPKKYLSEQPLENNVLSGRTGVVFKLSEGTLDGRIDITEIGGNQLFTILNVLDPKFENEKFNQLRSVLAVGYPTALELLLKEGFLDMNVQLRVLGNTILQSLHGLPVSNWIAGVKTTQIQQDGVRK